MSATTPSSLFLDRRYRSWYECSVLKQLTIGVLLAMALLLVPLRAPAQACGMSMPAAQKTACTDCCATMKSCVLPQQNPTNAATTETVNQPALTLVVPATPVLLGGLFVAPARCFSSTTPLAAHSPPRLAVLCTFLI